MLARYGCRNDFGITPMMVRGVPSITRLLPSTSGRAARVLRQKSLLMIATAAAPLRPSSDLKARPSPGERPSTEKKLEVTLAAGTTCAGEPLSEPTHAVP